MSDNKVNNKLDFRNMKTTQFDKAQAIKASFSELQSSLRTYQTSPILKDAYTHFIQETDGSDRPTKVTYYQAIDTAKDRINFRADSAGDLAGKYFSLQEYISQKTHVFYYVVDGNGTAPGIGDIETPIILSENDAASIVALESKKIIDTIDDFIVTKKGYLTSFIELEYLEFGETEAIDVGTSGFIATRLKEGQSYEVGEVDLSYTVEGYPIYNGSTLKGLLYNPYTAGFDVELSEINVTIVNPKTFNVQNFVVPLADTEVTLTLPDGVKKFKLQSKEPNTELYISNTSGGDTFTVRYGAFYEDDVLNTENVTLYVKTSRNNRNLELLTWS